MASKGAIRDQQQSNHKELPTKLWVVPKSIRGVTVDQYWELNTPPPSRILLSHISFNNTVIVLYRTDKKEPALLKTASPHRRKGSIKTLGLGLTLTKQIPTHAPFLQTSLTAKINFT